VFDTFVSLCNEFRTWSPSTFSPLLRLCLLSATQYCTASLAMYYNRYFLQSVQNAAARLVTRTGRCEHITQSVLRELHWLPVRRRVEFKIATLVFKALNGLAPPYLVDDCNNWSAITFADYVQLSPSRVRYLGQGHGQGSVTDRSPSPDHESGTVCLLRCERYK